jgi:transposase
MSNSQSAKPVTWREGRRLRAWELARQGWNQSRIAEALGVTAGAVSQWFKRAREGGEGALCDRVRPGRLSRLTAEQHQRIPELLGRGAVAWGFVGERWTRERVAEVVRRQFGVRYHPAHISRLLRRWGFSLQKPVRRARQRDETSIAKWRNEGYPTAEKRGPRKAKRASSSMRRASSCCQQ